MTIILIGYMGSGKSTIGLQLSRILKFDFVDLDAYIEKNEGKSIQELFKSKGEIYFRKIEYQYLQNVLEMENTVVSLGGGTPCYGKNMELITTTNHAKSVYLKASIPQLAERLENEKHDRPLIAHLKSKDELTEFIGKHLFERSMFYNKASITISVDKRSVNDVLENIVMELF